MIVLPCPYCGPRHVGEFAHLGEVVPRPDVATTSPEEWRAYLYLRSNGAGEVRERWLHRAGCRKFFDAVRDTTTNAVLSTSPLPGGPDLEAGR